VMGYSFGAATALRTAIQHPGLVRRLVLVSQPCRRDGWYPESLAGMDQMGSQLAEPMKQSPMYQIYSQVAPRVQDWPVLLDKTGDLLRQDFDWSADIAKITAPVMLVYGDADAVRPAHIVEFYGLLGGGLRDANWDGSARPVARLAILPSHTHYDIFASPDHPLPGRTVASAAGPARPVSGARRLVTSSRSADRRAYQSTAAEDRNRPGARTPAYQRCLLHHLTRTSPASAPGQLAPDGNGRRWDAGDHRPSPLERGVARTTHPLLRTGRAPGSTLAYRSISWRVACCLACCALAIAWPYNCR